jgi:hypothetical protein
MYDQQCLSNMISIASNTPLDASDVRDDDVNSFNVAKDEIRRIRKLAAEFLIASALTKSEATADFASSVEVEGDNEEIAEIDDELKMETADTSHINQEVWQGPAQDNRKPATREAMYDQQDQSNFVKVKIHKTPEVHSLINDATKSIALFDTFADEEILQIINVFKPVTFKGRDVVIRQGDVGSEFYVIESGQLLEQVEGDCTKSKVYTQGVTIGEMSLVFGLSSAANSTADTDVRVWVFERKMYISVIGSIRKKKLKFVENCVVGGHIFTCRFGFDLLEDFAIAAKVDTFEEGVGILREGDRWKCSTSSEVTLSRGTT